MYPIIDCHCHIYPDAIAARAVAGIGNFYNMPLCYSGTCDDLILQGTKTGIERFVVFSVATKPSQTTSINEFIASACQNNSRFTGLGTLHPDSPDLEGDLNRIEQLGLRGVKLHPDIQGFKIDDYRCLKIYELCEGRMPVLIHTGDSRFDLSNPNRMKPILEIFNGLTVIGAHLGGWSVWDDAAKELTQFDNFYVDCSSSLYSLPPEKAREIIRRYGSHRVLFGTDYPMWPIKTELERFFALGLDDEENRNILYKNAERLFSVPQFTTK